MATQPSTQDTQDTQDTQAQDTQGKTKIDGATYSYATDFNRGEDKAVFLAGKPVAHVKKDDLKINAEMEEISTKMGGKYEAQVLSKVKWSINIDAVLSNTEGHMSFNALANISASGKPVQLEVCEFEVKTREKGKLEFFKGKTIYKGMVTVSDVERSSAKGEYETTTATLNGYGALLDGAGNEFGTKQALQAIGIVIDENN